ncbi:MAG TPA: tetraacyldisaccharide 4'-kinase, partial [Steroidobacteraceae bacterium]|nr:tetraacyldisaccharide 4'-kinase [Steroidobacteraceae bacterium]
ALLEPFAWLYGAAMRVRRGAYERGWLAVHSAGRPVIVVGNLTVGGTGKTPLVLWLAARLVARGLTVGIVSRGYGRTTAGPRRVRSDSRWEEVGDEPLLIGRRSGCAVVVAEDRIAAARRLAAEGADVILSDDGLQHLRLARDFEIMVMDGARGFGRGRLLPAGPLREPASRALSVDYIVVNEAASSIVPPAALAGRTGPVARMHLVPGEAHRVDGDGRSRPLASFEGAPVHAVAGIGHPARFFHSLAARGLQLIEHTFADHHPFVRGELDFPDDLPILMTEKDAMRCESFATQRMWYVPVDAELEEGEAVRLLESVLGRIARKAADRAAALGERSGTMQAGPSSARVR